VSATHRAALFMMLFAGLWAAIEALGAKALGHYSPFQVVWTRYAVHLALMFAIWGWRNPQSLWATRRPVYHFARSLLMLGMPASFAFALRLGISDELLMTIFWLSPLMILVFAAIFLRERAPVFVWVLTAVGWLGTLVLFQPHPGPGRWALILPFVMAFTFSMYVVMTRPLRTEASHANLFYTALGVFLALSPVMPAVWVTPTPADLLVFVGIGIVGYLALFALDRMAAAAPVSIGAPFAFMQLVFMVAVGEAEGLVPVRSHIMLGALLITAAVGCVWWMVPRQSREVLS
jgi:drug/metabolite transporter (DMT)-like permease